MEIRPATVDDTDGIEAMVARRVQWMDEHGIPVSRDVAGAVAEQAGDGETPNWVLLDDGAVVGCTSAYTESPPWAFTKQERDVPAIFLASTWTAPTDRRLGWVLARWSLDHATRTGHQEVRRGTFAPALVRYYSQTQGWSVLREVERRGKTCTFLTRAAEERPDLAGVVDTETKSVQR